MLFVICFPFFECNNPYKALNQKTRRSVECLATKLIIAATTDPDMQYAAGLSIPDPFILIDTGRKRHLLVSSLEYGRAQKTLGRKKLYKIVLLDPLFQEVKKRLKPRKGQKIRKGSVMALIAARYLKNNKISKVEMNQRAWASHVDQLRKAGIKVSLGTLYPERATKTKQELQHIIHVRNGTVKAQQHCIDIIKKSRKNARNELVYRGKKVTSEFLKKEARIILLNYSCEAQELIISHGEQASYPHDAGSGVIKAGESVVMDFFPRSLETGYWFDMTRTVCKGTPNAALKKLYVTVRKAQDAALKKVRAGVTTGTIHKAASDVFIQAGYATSQEQGFIHGTGHGVGLQIHETPSLHPGATEKLKTGMVITIEPGLYYKKIGGVRLENTIVVTTTGYKDLTKMGRVLQV
jgi:Xaa-Pro aminopeptidase